MKPIAWEDSSQSTHFDFESTQHLREDSTAFTQPWENAPVLLLPVAVPTLQCSNLRSRKRINNPVPNHVKETNYHLRVRVEFEGA